jgi:hypothetical protein
MSRPIRRGGTTTVLHQYCPILIFLATVSRVTWFRKEKEKEKKKNRDKEVASKTHVLSVKLQASKSEKVGQV